MALQARSELNRERVVRAVLVLDVVESVRLVQEDEAGAVQRWRAYASEAADAKVTLTPVLRMRGENGIGFYNWGDYKNPKLDALAAASSIEPDLLKREQLIKAAFREQSELVHHIPLHRQVIPWAMHSDVDAVHRPDNWLEWRWVSIR